MPQETGKLKMGIDRNQILTTIIFVLLQKGLCAVKKRVLVSWVGHADIRSMAADQPKSQQQKILDMIRAESVLKDGSGPIKTLLEAESFDQIHLLSNYPSYIGTRFKSWAGGLIKIHNIDLKNPTDYEEVFTVVDKILGNILDSKLLGADPELCIHLSPGTPTMTAIWVLLGKSRYPASFYQTHKGKAWKTDIPFDLVMDFLPELLSEPDRHLQHLASAKPEEIEGFQQIAGKTQAIRLAVGRANKAAIRDVPVLILGESGTGKELFARAIHVASHRKDKPFIVLNCAAVPKELLESELFGHKKGAFTGATGDRAGAFESANGGTLFLDEVGECDPVIQAKLLRVLQPPADSSPCHRVFRRLGEDKDRTADVRIIAATNRDLHEAISDGRFREDMFYRLAVITITIPSLRDRKQDIPIIAEKLVGQINAMFCSQEPGYKDKYLSDSTNTFVKSLLWPGNVRQLYNILLQAAVMADGDCIEKHDIRQALGAFPSTEQTNILEQPLGGDFSLEDLLNSIQKQYLQRAMAEANGVKTKAARLLGMRNYQTLDAQIKKLKVKW